MTTKERLRTEFPGISVMISGVADALRAYHAYNKALEDMESIMRYKKGLSKEQLKQFQLKRYHKLFRDIPPVKEPKATRESSLIVDTENEELKEDTKENG